MPARWPLISTSTWLLKSRPWPSVAAPRMLIEVWPGVHSLRKPTAFCASSSATDFAVERSMTDRSRTCTAPTTRPAGPGVSAAPGPAAGESAATRSRPPITWTVPVTRLRGSGRPPGVTTTSPRLTCAEAAENDSTADRIAAAISAARKAKSTCLSHGCLHRYAAIRARRIFSECRAGARADRFSPGLQDARSSRDGGLPAIPNDRRDSARAVRDRGRCPRTSIPRARPTRAAPTAPERGARCRCRASRLRHATAPEGSPRSTSRAGHAVPARPTRRRRASRRGSFGRNAPGACRGAAILAARTVSCAPAGTSAASHPSTRMRGGYCRRASRARMVAEGSIAVQPRLGTRKALPSCPPPAPTSSRSPISPTLAGRAAPRARRSRRCRWLRRRARSDRWSRTRRRTALPRPTQRSAWADRGCDQEGRTRRRSAATIRHRELPPFRPCR